LTECSDDAYRYAPTLLTCKLVFAKETNFRNAKLCILLHCKLPNWKYHNNFILNLFFRITKGPSSPTKFISNKPLCC